MGVMGVMGVRDEGRVSHTLLPPIGWLPLRCFHMVAVTFKFVLHILVPISQTCACTREHTPGCLRLNTWTEVAAHARARGAARGDVCAGDLS